MGIAVYVENKTSMIQALKRGDSSAYEKAVREYSPGMLAVARFYLDPSSAEDTVQDSWVAVIDAIHKFEGRSSLKTWLHRIVANRCKNKLRSSNREVATDFSGNLEPELAARFNAEGRWNLPPKLRFHESADILLENNALRNCLDKHLSALSVTQCSALMLYEAHQRKSRDVCDILNISASNLRVLVHRARQKIFLMVETYKATGEC